MILVDGLGALTFGDLARRTGLARPSIYEYFRTKSDLAIALVGEESSKWRADVSVVMSCARSKEDMIAEFVRVILQLVKAGKHELSFVLAVVELDVDACVVMIEAHRALFELIVLSLEQMGVWDVFSCVEMIGGVVMAVGQVLRHDLDRCGLIDRVVVFSVAGACGCVY